MTAAEAHAAASEEGLVLLRGRSNNATGFKGVGLSSNVSKPYTAQSWHGGRHNSLGTFATAEEAALAVARFLGPEGVAAAQAAAAPGPAPMTAAEAHAAAAQEGLSLLRAENQTGFKHVAINDRGSTPFRAQMNIRGRTESLGSFATAEEAALVVARFLRGPTGGSAAQAAEALQLDALMAEEEVEAVEEEVEAVEEAEEVPAPQMADGWARGPEESPTTSTEDDGTDSPAQMDMS